MQESEKQVIRQAMELMKIRAEKLIESSLVPIYLRPGASDLKTHQIGTGFLIAVGQHRFMVTARHVLFGHLYDENLSERHIVFNGRLRSLAELNSGEVVFDHNSDLAVAAVNEFDLNRGLPISCLMQGNASCNLIAIYGFLARDFHRFLKTSTLRPRPFFYVNRSFQYRTGYVGILYPKSRNRDTITGLQVQSPRPVGLSGCPMIDATKLISGNVRIVGVFTDYQQGSGRAFGENASKVLALLMNVAINYRADFGGAIDSPLF